MWFLGDKQTAASVNFGFVVSDTFNVTNNGTTITGGSFGMWLFSGDTLTSAELSITSGENSGTSYFDQTVNFTQGSCVANQYGYNRHSRHLGKSERKLRGFASPVPHRDADSAKFADLWD